MEVEAVYKNIPSFTKFYLGLFVTNTCLISFDLVSPETLELDYAKVITGFELWRILTCFGFCRGFSFLFVFLIVLSHVCLSTIEKYYQKRVHDFYYMLFFVVSWHLFLGFLLDTYQDMMTEFLCTLMYIYCRREREDTVQVFGVLIKALYFPWVWIVLWKISGYPIIKIVAGYTIGHLYDYLKFTLPSSFGYNVLKTPNWFKWLVSKIATRLLKIRKLQQQQANEVSVISLYLYKYSLSDWLKTSSI